MTRDQSGTVPVQAGQVAPPFELPAIVDGGGQVTVSIPGDLASGPMLLVFYQDDGMPICTSELKAFAQEFELLQGAGIQVVGMNTNGLGSHARFHERDHYPFPLVSDFHGDAVKAYGLWDADEGKSRRAVVIVGQDGLVKYVQPHFNPGNVNAIVEVFSALGLA
ncbi:MAG: redoxin domain-containing protein [Dehalococcoidia bacterium]|nr:redoxin domain-containing protein [Dehalococcoidia bacterium]MCB9484790.1 redoxin domain-containing protein [Thermoflexaceae bacterium]